MENQTYYERAKANAWRTYQDKCYEGCVSMRETFDGAFLRGYRCGIEEAAARTGSDIDHIPDAAKKVDRAMIAAMAMQGLLNATIVGRTSISSAIAEAAVEYADALIKELEKEEK